MHCNAHYTNMATYVMQTQNTTTRTHRMYVLYAPHLTFNKFHLIKMTEGLTITSWLFRGFRKQKLLPPTPLCQHAGHLKGRGEATI